ncbi:transporter substrate-binding domain-containing protein [Halosquirtibacter laminarini]|uniref:Transporter substrate-binding domain-containing protein n=1 Tax=Halosquirtibacter laminarini TaxID=3374600 RepID=A0AC61NP28_9BACT|nr:transporter substrate-binding domain-containing protein [Prolixibacteraceae bacterium]
MRSYIKHLILMLFIFASCKGDKNLQKEVGQAQRDAAIKELENIQANGTLKVVIDYNSINYFIYRGLPMGFQYDILHLLADDMDVDLDIRVSNNLRESYDLLESRSVDIVAKNLTITKSLKSKVLFTYPMMSSRQVLVQPKPHGWEKMDSTTLEKSLIRDVRDLADKTVYVQKNTAYFRRLNSLSDEIGEDINIVTDSIHGVEQLIGMVAKGDVPMTVCSEEVARLNHAYNPNIDISTPVSFTQDMAWAVRKTSTALNEYVSKWLLDFSKTRKYRRLYTKYYTSSRSKRYTANVSNAIHDNRLSAYDELIKEASKNIRWDWRLVASVVYQESNFNPEAESWAGAVGLMQLMPETADRYNVEDLTNPAENIHAGTRYLGWLDSYFKDQIDDPNERIKFVLASYNIGLGHILDARRLANKYGKDMNIWDNNVAPFLLKKSLSKYYKDPVVKWGYCRGTETTNYVEEVVDRYQSYSNLLLPS